MKPFVTPPASAAAWAMGFVCVLATAQTKIDMYSQAKNIDFSQATSTRPFPVGSVLPAVCAAGETFFKSDAPAGQNLYLCTARNVWTPVETTSMNMGADNTYTGHNDFSSAQSLTVQVLPSKPVATGCDEASEVGRVVLRRSNPSSDAGILYLCQSTSAGTAEWKASTYAYGTARPLNCDAGELFFDIGAPAGQQWLGCIAANTWMNLSGSGVPTASGSAGKLLGTDGSTTEWRSVKGFMDVGTALIPNGNVLGELGGNNTWSGHQSYPPSTTQTIVSAASKIVCNAHTVAISSASPVTLSSTATVENGANGQVCVVVNVGADTVILQDEDNLPSSNLQLAAPTIEIAPKASVRLMFNSTIGDWIQERDGTALVPNGLGELSGNNNWSGHQSYPPSSTQTIASAASKIVCNAHTVAISSASPITLSSTATVRDGADGQVCVVVNVGAGTVILQDEDNLTGSNLQLAAPTIEIAPKASVRLMFNSTIGDWIQERDGTALVPAGLAELSGNNNWSGHQSYPPSSTQTIVSAASTIACNAHTVAISSANPVTLSSTATVGNGADGQVCVVVNVGAGTVILQDEDNLTGSNLQLAAPTIEIAPKASIRLMFNSTIGDWIQERDGTALVPAGLAELSGNNNWSGHQSYPPSSTQTIVSAASTIACNAHTVAISSANPVTLSSTATVGNGADGQVCVVVNVGPATVVLQDEDKLPSSNLQLAAPTIEIAPKASVRLMFSSTIGDWIQEGVNTQPSTIHAPKCGAGTTGTNGTTVAEILASHTFQAGELAPGDYLRLTAFWQHMPGPNGTLDSAFRTQLKFGSGVLQETTMPAATDQSLFSEYWIYISGTSETAVQRHFRTTNSSFLTTAATASLTVPLANATITLQARASNAPGSDDAVALSAYCIELVRGR